MHARASVGPIRAECEARHKRTSCDRHIQERYGHGLVTHHRRCDKWCWLCAAGTNDTISTMTERASSRAVAARANTTRQASAVPRPTLGIGNRLADAALTLIIGVLALRLALALAVRTEGVGTDRQTLTHTSAAVVVAVILLGVWAVFLAPTIAGLLLHPLRSAPAATQFPRLMFVTALTVVLPLVYAGLVYTLFDGAPESLHRAALALVSIALATPAAVFLAGTYVARVWLAKIIVLLIALASVIHLAFWIA